MQRLAWPGPGVYSEEAATKVTSRYWVQPFLEHASHEDAFIHAATTCVALTVDSARDDDGSARLRGYPNGEPPVMPKISPLM